MELREEALSLATSRAREEGAGQVSAAHIQEALLELGVISAVALDRREAARRRYRLLVVAIASLAALTAATFLLYVTDGWSSSITLDRTDKIASAAGVILSTASVFLAFYAFTRTKQAADATENLSHVVQDRVRAANFLALWAELEDEIRATVAERSGDARGNRPVGILFKDYAQLAELNEKERNQLTSVLALRNTVAHSRLDPTTAAEELTRASAIIGEHIKRARSLTAK
ncbi:hypothetical protein ACIBP4_07455 [Micromonospora maritima]|uniref:Uncharacterized protein n=1 Tax=Micromonospora maritima TaxID=986711 RepID=A0ABW7ZGY9_9ACTN